ncbi:hypothetical protein LEP1GSC075_2148 [Leptospira interrogans str. Kito]|nr:hypothetical protein LEP1GSC075_2148 [Leptospira interrogans str. Kito]EMO95552.1 hypothetical protein LEP1GSC109_0643 [Leptospira interrogans str. UI 13372]
MGGSSTILRIKDSVVCSLRNIDCEHFGNFSIFKNDWTIISSWSKLEEIGFSFF